jgi:predicted transcriptional regulator
MVDALAQAEDSGGRQAALVHFVERVGADEADALRRALAELEINQRSTPQRCTPSTGVTAED